MNKFSIAILIAFACISYGYHQAIASICSEEDLTSRYPSLFFKSTTHLTTSSDIIRMESLAFEIQSRADLAYSTGARDVRVPEFAGDVRVMRNKLLELSGKLNLSKKTVPELNHLLRAATLRMESPEKLTLQWFNSFSINFARKTQDARYALGLSHRPSSDYYEDARLTDFEIKIQKQFPSILYLPFYGQFPIRLYNKLMSRGILLFGITDVEHTVDDTFYSLVQFPHHDVFGHNYHVEKFYFKAALDLGPVEFRKFTARTAAVYDAIFENVKVLANPGLEAALHALWFNIFHEKPEPNAEKDSMRLWQTINAYTSEHAEDGTRFSKQLFYNLVQSYNDAASTALIPFKNTPTDKIAHDLENAVLFLHDASIKALKKSI